MRDQDNDLDEVFQHMTVNGSTRGQTLKLPLAFTLCVTKTMTSILKIFQHVTANLLILAVKTS